MERVEPQSRAEPAGGGVRAAAGQSRGGSRRRRLQPHSPARRPPRGRRSTDAARALPLLRDAASAAAAAGAPEPESGKWSRSGQSGLRTRAPGGVHRGTRGPGKAVRGSPSSPVPDRASREQHRAHLGPLFPGLGPQLPPSSGRVSGGSTPPPRYWASAILVGAGRARCACAFREDCSAQPRWPLSFGPSVPLHPQVSCTIAQTCSLPESRCRQRAPSFRAPHTQFFLQTSIQCLLLCARPPARR